MAPKQSPQDRLDALTKICLALPETRREDKGSHAAFLVGKKTFAYYLNNHHGDNIISVSVRSCLVRIVSLSNRTRAGFIYRHISDREGGLVSAWTFRN